MTRMRGTRTKNTIKAARPPRKVRRKVLIACLRGVSTALLATV
jgi:hypothetical protein